MVARWPRFKSKSGKCSNSNVKKKLQLYCSCAGVQRKDEVLLPWHTGGGGLALGGVRGGAAKLVEHRLVAE